MITEVEAYDGPNDLAAHASRGRRTTRNEIMYEVGGVWYIYFVYGMYEMLNIVTREPGYPAAILIRGVLGYNGPGKLTKALGITRAHHGKRAMKSSGLWIEDRGTIIRPKDIARTPRIGIGYAGEVWTAKPWRFVLKK